MRTHGEVVQFVKQCVKIEQKGGDVLGYIAKNWPSYTPRATWYNLQREYLNRMTHQLTEGKPKVKIERKEEEPMKKREDTELLAKAVIQCHQTGGDVRKLLLDRGYKDASAELSNLKCKFKRKDPELYLELKEIRLQRVSTRKAKKPVPEHAKAEVGEHPTEAEKAPETPEKRESVDDEYMDVRSRVNEVFFGGKAYEKMDKPSPTCCQPARPSGVSVPDGDVEPETSCTLKVNSVKSRLGVYSLSNVSGAMSFRMDQNGIESELTMTKDDWKIFTVEILMALDQLGL